MTSEERFNERKAEALAAMNKAAGLPGGYDDDGSPAGISFGYIGNCSMHPGGYDDRSWRFFRPHPKMDERSMGCYSDPNDLLDAFDNNTARFIEWAKGARQ
jgi:hypothetical protein